MEKMTRAPGRERIRREPDVPCVAIRRMAARLLLPYAAAAVLAAPAASWTAPSNPLGLAVIVGNRDYLHPDMPLADHAHRDARAFRRYVIDVLGYDPDNVIHLEDATSRQMFDVFGSPTATTSHIQSRLNALAPEGGSDVVVYYSGHGVPGKEGASLLPVDITPSDARTGGYSMKLLYRKLGALQRTQSVRVFVDAGFSGASDGGLLIRHEPLYRELGLPGEVPDNLMILTAATGPQVASWDTEAGHGLFTHHLLDALYGEGDANGDGKVTALEAKAYLDGTMSLIARRRHYRIQLVNLVGATETVVASAGIGDEFPSRPEPSSAFPEADAETPGAAETADGANGTANALRRLERGASLAR